MKQPYLLSGENLPLGSKAAQRRMPFLRVIVVLWLLGGLTFFLAKFWGVSGTSEVPNVGATTEPAVSEDTLHHIEVANEELQAAIGALRQMDGQVSKTIDSLDRQFMLVEKKRLANALAASAAARRQVEQARQEIDLVVRTAKGVNNE